MNFVEIENQTKLKILKIVLLQKIVFKILYRSKEERIKNLEKWVRKGYVTDFDLDEMIAALKAELEKQLNNAMQRRKKEFKKRWKWKLRLNTDVVWKMSSIISQENMAHLVHGMHRE